MMLDEIDKLAATHAKNISALEKLVTTLNADLEALKKKVNARLKTLSSKCAVSEIALAEAIEEAPELFVKPRTMKLHSIKLGYQASKDGLEYDEEKMLTAIKRKLADLQDVLIKTTEKPVASALKNLPAEQQKKIGVKVVLGSDQVVIKHTDSATEKLVGGFIAAGKKAAAGG